MPRPQNRHAVILGAAGALVAAGLAWRLEAHRRNERTALIHRTMVELLLNTLCAGDPSTARHSRRVADLTNVIGRTYRMNGEERARLRIAALLHDLGKLDDRVFAIVHSSQKLSQTERHQIEDHTNQSAGILEPLEMIHPGISKIVESHHERWDGKGYPRRLSRTSIPLESRIISVADVFDALTEPRSYKGASPAEDALRQIRKEAGTMFDPEVVERLDRAEVWNAWHAIAREGRHDEERLPATASSDESPSGSAEAR